MGLGKHDLCKWLAAAALALCAALPAAAAAQEARDPAVAVLDVQRVLRDSSAAQSIRTSVDALRAREEEAIEAERQRILEDEKTLRKQETILAPEVLNRKRRDLEQRYAGLRRRAEQVNTALNQAVNEGMGRLRSEMAQVLGDVMQERSVNITLPRAAVLLFDPDLNITDDVLARLDERLPTIEVNLQAAPPPQQ